MHVAWLFALVGALGAANVGPREYTCQHASLFASCTPLSWSDDGRYLACNMRNISCIVDTQTGEKVDRFDQQFGGWEPGTHRYAVLTNAYVSAQPGLPGPPGPPRPLRLDIVDAESERSAASVEVPPIARDFGASFSDDGRYVATAHKEGVQVFDTEALAVVATVPFPSLEYVNLTWRPGTHALLIAYVTGTWATEHAEHARLINVDDGQTLYQSDASVSARMPSPNPAWSPHGASFAAPAEDGHSAVHSVTTQPLVLLAQGDGAWGFLWNEPGDVLVAQWPTLAVFDPATGARTYTPSEELISVGWLDADRLLVQRGASDDLWALNVRTHTLDPVSSATVKRPGYSSPALSPDQQLLSMSSSTNQLQEVLRLEDASFVKEARYLHRIGRTSEGIRHVSWAPDARAVAYGFGGGFAVVPVPAKTP